MAFTASAVWEVESGGDDTNFGGGFDTGVAGFPTDGVITLATTSAPVLASASYNFVTADTTAGAWLYIKAGTAITPGWYKSVSISSNAVVLDAAIGHAVLASGTPNTVVGCGTGAGPWTSVTWGIDYSQNTSSRISFNDMLVGATTTQFTSVNNPVGKNYIGNVISVTSGATVQRVAVVSTSGTTATCDKSLGTAAQVGVGQMGGALASIGLAGSLFLSGNQLHIKTGSYSISSATANISGGCFAPAAAGQALVAGYATVRGDFGTAPTFTATSTISTFTIFTATSNSDSDYINLTADCTGYTSSKAFNLGRSIAYKLKALNCTNGGIDLTGTAVSCSATGCSTTIAFPTSATYIYCEAYTNTVGGFVGGRFISCLAYNNTLSTSDGFAMNGTASAAYGCVAYGNGRDGFRGGASSGAHTMIAVNCIAEGNTGIGFNRNNNSYFALLNCATFNNSGGATSTASDPIVGGLVVGTVSFFIAAATGNFALNNTPGGGALCRAAGIPGVYPSGTTTGFADIGIQSRVPWQTTNLSGGLIG